VLVGLATFTVVLAVIGAITGPPPAHQVPAGNITPAPPAQAVTTGQGELQTTDPQLARDLAARYATADVYLVPRLAWPTTTGSRIAWVWPTGCDHDDTIACQAVGLTYNR
jgi:hypothetical protein